MRILFLTPYFPPETSAAPARAWHFARALVRAGHAVRVVTGLPSHPSGIVPPQWRDKAGTLEVVEGIEVQRVWLYATPRKSPLGRLWNHLSFACTSLPAMLAGPRPDVVLVSTPPLFHGLSAWCAARWHGAALVDDCRDDWPFAAIALGEMSMGFVASVLDGIARFVQRRSARVLAVTPGMLRRFEARGLERHRLVALPNGSDTELFHPAEAPPQRASGEPFTIVYAGTHGLVHGMEAILDAAALMHREPVRFVFIGDGVAKAALQERAEREGLTHCVFEPSLTPERLVERLRAADVCLATTLAGPLAGEVMPVKVFDYLAVGVPVVAMVQGDAADVVMASGGGLVVAPGDASGLLRALQALRDDPALRARLASAGAPFIQREYSRRALGERLVALLEAVHLEQHGRPVVALPSGAHGVLKRALDLVVSATALVVLAPLLLAIALAVRIDSPGPALFAQRRSGRGGRTFVLYKFRSMATGTPDLATHLVQPGAVTVTRIGAFLRRTSLDELPQLWNILRGDMTLVGPRPALHNQHDLIAMRQEAGVDALVPGLTGWAQVNGRDEIPMQRKVALDREYLERVSWRLDLDILVRTATTLFTMRGVR